MSVVVSAILLPSQLWNNPQLTLNLMNNQFPGKVLNMLLGGLNKGLRLILQVQNNVIMRNYACQKPA